MRLRMGIGIVAGTLVCAVVLGVLLPNFVDPPRRRPDSLNSIINNLRIIEGAKDQWTSESRKTIEDMPTVADLSPYLKDGEMPRAVIDEIYEINPVGTPATAKIPRKVGPYDAGSTITIP